MEWAISRSRPCGIAPICWVGQVTFRPDFPIARHLAESFTPQLAASWQAQPYVLLPGEGFTDYAIVFREGLATAMPNVEELPWEEAIFDYPTGLLPLMKASIRAAADHMQLGTEHLHLTFPDKVEAMDRGRCWMRVVDGPRYLQLVSAESPWLAGGIDLLAPFRHNPSGWFAVETWEERTNTREGGGGLPSYPDVSIVPKANCWDYTKQAHLFPNQGCRSGRVFGDGHGFCNYFRCPYTDDRARSGPCVHSNMVMSCGVVLLLATLAYLAGCDEYLVEVTPQLTEKQRKQAQRYGEGSKPWTRDDLPYFILIDPNRAREYGRKESEQGGSHASPRPHSRRGHWRELRAERYEREMDGSARRVWIKPVWIGAMEWVDQGQSYKVVPPKIVRP